MALSSLKSIGMHRQNSGLGYRYKASLYVQFVPRIHFHIPHLQLAAAASDLTPVRRRSYHRHKRCSFPHGGRRRRYTPRRTAARKHCAGGDRSAQRGPVIVEARLVQQLRERVVGVAAAFRQSASRVAGCATAASAGTSAAAFSKVRRRRQVRVALVRRSGAADAASSDVRRRRRKQFALDRCARV